jgi:hypothetical protein
MSFTSYTNVFAIGLSIGCSIGSYAGYKVGNYFTKKDCLKQMEEVLEKVKVINIQDVINKNFIEVENSNLKL